MSTWTADFIGRCWPLALCHSRTNSPSVEGLFGKATFYAADLTTPTKSFALSLATAAASLAIGTRGPEQET